MGSINTSSILSKLNKYVKSKEGQDKIAYTLHEYEVNGITMTNAGSIILTNEVKYRVAQALIEEIRATAEMYRDRGELPDSIASLAGSLGYGSIQIIKGGTYFGSKIELSFQDDVHRNSLWYENKETGARMRTGDGIDNIVMLFNDGYGPINQVRGHWETHNDMFTGSKVYRERLGFIDEAIANFNSTDGVYYNCYAYKLGG